MEIQLGNKIYKAPKHKARIVRRAIELSNGMDRDDFKPEDLDELVDFMVALFGKQFTIDDVYDELDSDQLMPTLYDCINNLVGTMGGKLEQFPNTEPGK